MGRLIDADALEKDYRDQFDSVYKHTREAVKPEDFYIERRAAYDKELVRMEMEAFCKYLQSRPTVDAVPVVRCKDCFYRDRSDCPIFINPDEGFCHLGSLTGD